MKLASLRKFWTRFLFDLEHSPDRLTKARWELAARRAAAWPT